MVTEAHKWICGAGGRSLIATVIGLALSVSTASCANAPLKTQKTASEKVSSKAAEMRRLKNQRKQRARLQDLKERNLVIEQKKKMNKVSAPDLADAEKPTELPGSFDEYAGGESIAAAPAVTASPIVSAAPTAATGAAPQVPTSVSPAKTGEHFLYSKILETYRLRNDLELQKTLQLLLKTYPESVFADNAIYLAGLLAFENGDYRVAEKKFEQLLKEYPRSNKAVSALFAKAAIEKRSGRMANAKRSFIRVRNQYPGSPEAARVSVELKLLETSKMKSRES